MAVYGLLTGKGSPGATTSALALALTWPLRPRTSGEGPHRVLVVEADPAGSSTRPGYLAGSLDQQYGLVSVLSQHTAGLAKAIRHNLVAIEDEPDRWLLPGLGSPRQVAAASDAWPRLAGTLQAFSLSGDTDVVIDFGRWTARGHAQPLVDVVDLFVVMVNSDLPSVLGARHVVRALCDGEDVHEDGRGGDAPPRGVGCVVIGEGNPYSAREIEGSLAVPVIATLAWDPRAALPFSHGVPRPRGFRKSSLLRSARRAAEALVANADPVHDLDAGIGPSQGSELRANNADPDDLGDPVGSDDLDDDLPTRDRSVWAIHGGDLDD